MHSRFWTRPYAVSLKSSVRLVALAVFSGLYTVIIGGLGNWKLTFVFWVLPIFLGTVTLKHAPKIWFAFLVFSLSFSARFRLPGQAFHPGGAELALAPMDFPLISLALLFLLRLPKLSRTARPSLWPLSWPIVFFFIAHLLSVIPAPNRSLAWLEVFRLLKMVLFAWVMAYYLNSRKKIVFVANILMLMIIAQGVLAITQSVFHLSLGLDFLGEHQFWVVSEGGTEVGRAGGTLGHANVLANFFEVLTPIGLALLLSGAKGRLRLLAKGAVPLGIIGTFLTSSRAGWVALIIGLLLVIVQLRQRISKTRMIFAVFAVGLAIGLIGLTFRDIIEARLTVFLKGSKIVREVTAQTALNMLRSNSMFGVGANNYLEVSGDYIGVPSYSGLARFAAANVHNIILLYGAELGLVGLVALGVLLLSLWRLARRIIRRGDPLLASLSAGSIAGIMSLIAHGMWDWLFRYDPVFALFWFTAGLLVAMKNILYKESVHYSDSRQ